MSSTDGKLVMAVEIEEETRYGESTLRLAARAARYNQDDDTVRHLFYWDDDDSRLSLADFTVSALNDDRNVRAGRANNRSFGWDFYYNGALRVKLPRARSMVSTLTRIEKRLDKLTEIAGPAATFGSYLVRVAGAVGIDTFVWKAPDMLPNGYRHRVMTALAVESWLTSREMDFVHKHEPTETSEAAS